MSTTMPYTERNGKLLLRGILLVVVTFVVLDSYLCFLVMSLSHETTLPISTNSSTNPCYVSPFCYINVKTLLLDPPNFYFHMPLSSAFIKEVDFTDSLEFISANAISIMHIPIAFVASKMINRESLCDRRIGVLLFELRTFFDALDGGVARLKRKQNYVRAVLHTPLTFNQTLSTTSESKSQESQHTFQLMNANANRVEINESMIGYWIDGICDGIGCIFLFLACFAYLQRHPLKGSSLFAYNSLPLVIVSDATSDSIRPLSNLQKKVKYTRVDRINEKFLSLKTKRHAFRLILRSSQSSGFLAVVYGFQTLFGSITWNRYITAYTRILENNLKGEDEEFHRINGYRMQLLQSPMMWTVIFIWRYINPHAWVEILLVAIFVDKMGEILYVLRYMGFIIIATAAFFTEVYMHDINLNQLY